MEAFIRADTCLNVTSDWWLDGCRRLKEATGRLVVAWVLASACLTGHLAHLWKGPPAWLHLLGRPSVHAAMSALALIGAVPAPAACPAPLCMLPCLHWPS